MIINDVKDIREGFVQVFNYTPLNTGSVGGDEVYKLCKTGLIDSDIAAVAKYLYKYKCAPLSYLAQDLNIDIETLEPKMKELVKKRIFNNFMLADRNELYTEDSLLFYTIDYGAIWLLRSIDEDENIENWKAVDNYMTGLKVKKCLMLLDFYRNIRDNVEFFKPYEMYLTYGARLRTKAVFKMKEGKTYLLEIVTEDDLLTGAKTNMVEKVMHYEQLLCTDGWKYAGFGEVPNLLILSDSEKVLEKFKDRISDCKVENIDFSVI